MKNATFLSVPLLSSEMFSNFFDTSGNSLVSHKKAFTKWLQKHENAETLFIKTA